MDLTSFSHFIKETERKTKSEEKENKDLDKKNTETFLKDGLKKIAK